MNDDLDDSDAESMNPDDLPTDKLIPPLGDLTQFDDFEDDFDDFDDDFDDDFEEEFTDEYEADLEDEFGVDELAEGDLDTVSLDRVFAGDLDEDEVEAEAEPVDVEEDLEEED